MTTKEQERKALEQIKKIVAGLGDGSYIGTAFEGCFEVAETNIENDWACSFKQQIESLEERNESQAKDIERLLGVKEHLEKKVDDQIQQTNRNWQLSEENAEDARMWLKRAEDRQKKIDELAASVADKDKVLAERDFEIMQLKAKLYDLMVK